MGLKDFALTGKTAIVTGSAGGIGKGIASTTAEAGAIGPTESFYVPSWNVSREEHEKSFEVLKSFIPKRRFGSVRELGLSCVFLASAAGNYYNGQILVPDGGISQAF